MISLVIPAYNAQATLTRAVESAVLQRNLIPELEIIVVDDGSTDNSIEGLEERLIADIKVIRQANQGVSAARNSGIRIAKHELVILLDADDELLPNAASTFLSLASQFPDAAFYSGVHYRVSENSHCYLPKGAWSQGRFGYVHNFAQEYRRNRALVNSSSVCLRKVPFRRVGGFPVSARLGEDVYLWIRMSFEGPLAHTGTPVSRVYRNLENRSANRNILNLSPPYFIQYFNENRDGMTLSSSNRCVRRLIFHLSLLNSLGAVETGSRGRALAISSCYSANPFKWLALRIIAECPPWLIRIARQARERCVLAWRWLTDLRSVR